MSSNNNNNNNSNNNNNNNQSSQPDNLTPTNNPQNSQNQNAFPSTSGQLSQPAYAPGGFTPGGFTPGGFTPAGMTPGGFTPVGYGPNGYTPGGHTPRTSRIMQSQGANVNPGFYSQGGRTPVAQGGRPGYGLNDISSPRMLSQTTPMSQGLRRNMFTSDFSEPLYYPSNATPVGSQARHMIIGEEDGIINDTPFNTTRGIVRGDIQRTPVQNPQYSYNSQQPASEGNPLNVSRTIWGTTIQIQDTLNSFRKFLNNFTMSQKLGPLDLPMESNDISPYYPQVFESMQQTQNYSMNLDCSNLIAFDTEHKLYNQLVKYPQEVIPLMDYALSEAYGEFCGLPSGTGPNLRVRPFGLDSSVNMRDLNPNDIDKLVTIKGLLIRASNIIPDLKLAFFKCSTCDHSLTVGIDRGKINEPTICPRNDCQQRNTMELIHNRCEYSDKQVCRLQETPDSIPDGQTPHTVSLCLYDDLVDASKPGDRLEVTGIFRSVPVRVNPRNTTVKSLFKTYLDVVHLKKTNSKRVEDHIDENIDIAKETSQSTGLGTFTETQVKEIEELSKDPDVYKILANSIAPSIFGMDDIKKGILLQLFGGTDKHFDSTSSPKARGDINILLVGDPGTSKSQLLQKAHHISPRGMYTSGKGSSAVGLTAYVTRDAETRQLVLESGALVLSDGGLCCIDEFDKMSDSTRSILHEVMEQQTVSVAKAGIITTLNARTSILACANPIGSQWNRNLSVPENINLPPSLLSRFDLVYLILDKAEPDHDRHLAKHLVSLYLKDRPDLVSNTIPLPLLTRYVTYAKAAIKPVLNEEASREIVKAYVELRKAGQGNRNQSTRITATTRQLESMVRLSEAHAKVRLSNEVTKEDVFEACRLLREAIKASATDPTTGLIDWDILATGVGAQTRIHLDSMKSELRKLISNLSLTTRYNLVQERFKDQSSIEISTRDFDRVVRELQGEGFLEIINDNSPNKAIKRLVGRDDN